MSEPTLTSTSEPLVYRPLSGLAVAGFALAVLFTFIVLIGFVNSLLKGAPLFLPDWMFALPIAGFILSLLGDRHIRGSEGTRAGFKLVRYGLWLSALVGLGYFIYIKGTILAVSQQARAYVMDEGPQSGFLPRLLRAKDHPTEVNIAYLLTLPPKNKQGANPEDNSAMSKQFDQPPKDAPFGLLTAFREHVLVQTLSHFGPQAKIEPLGVKRWKYENNSYEINYLYRITTPEWEVELPVRTLSIEPHEPGERRQWVVIVDKYLELTNRQKRTPLGETIEAYRRTATGFFMRWIHEDAPSRGFAFADKDKTDWAKVPLPPNDRDQLRGLLNTRFAKGANRHMSLSPFQGDYIAPCEKVDGMIRFSFRCAAKLLPAGPGDWGYLAEMRVIVQTKEAAGPIETAAWEIASVVVTRTMAADPSMIKSNDSNR